MLQKSNAGITEVGKQRESQDKAVSNGQYSVSATTNTSRQGGTITQTLLLSSSLFDHVKKLPTLILTLRDKLSDKLSKMSQQEQDQYLEQHLNDLHAMLHRNINDFQEIVLSARPSMDQVNTPGYDQQREMYNQVLQISTAMIKRMRETIKKTMDDYKLFIEEVWNAICAGQSSSPMLSKFQAKLEQMMKESWEPIFADVEKLKAEIAHCKNAQGHST
ncbi:unnamed protein product [Adineta ricciae]|uniref:Uncharacterized protein n=1 Tax=Adineta ricciae TaxID=249248 RepID=A0A816DL71_ADIRI|nr:unnamed protein product [Adineta ricciae]